MENLKNEMQEYMRVLDHRPSGPIGYVYQSGTMIMHHTAFQMNPLAQSQFNQVGDLMAELDERNVERIAYRFKKMKREHVRERSETPK